MQLVSNVIEFLVIISVTISVVVIVNIVVIVMSIIVSIIECHCYHCQSSVYGTIRCGVHSHGTPESDRH